MAIPFILAGLLGLPGDPAPLEVIAHRGVHQPVRRDVKVDNGGCTASPIGEVEHGFIENTIPSIRAAFEHGATVVEIDVHGTSDGEMVVFHDWTLECRTDGTGVTEEQSLWYLRSLDIGHGYTREGRTYPFRGRGLRMPTLREVLKAFPGRRLLVNMKSGSMVTLGILVGVLREFPGADLAFFCNRAAINEAMRRRVPHIRVPRLARTEVKRCLAGFVVGGVLPAGCDGAEMTMPFTHFQRLGVRARYLLRALEQAGSSLFVWGVDDEEAMRYVLNFPVAGVVTDRIEEIGRLLDR